MRKVHFRVGRPAEVVAASVPVRGRGQWLVCTEAVGVGVGLVRMLEPGGAVRPGAEMVGTVVAAGPDSAGFEAGDRVGGVAFADANAGLVLADPRLVSHVPAKVDAAAALALVWSHRAQRATAGRVAPGSQYWSPRRPAVQVTWQCNWPRRSEQPGWSPPPGRRTWQTSPASAEPTRW